jgi:predicted nucleic acid binding AN1-type Zn finger protein
VSPVESEKTVEVPTISEKAEEVKPEDPQKDRKRCYKCNKKVGLLGTESKCCLVFCNAHRLPEAHSCDFDFRVRGQKELEKTVIKVDHGKIIKI